MSVRLRLAFSRALLCGVALPGAIALGAPVVAAAQVAPDESVASVRLSGSWGSSTKRYIFTPAEDGRMRFRVIRTDTGAEEARGVLSADLGAGLMRGQVGYGPAEAPQFSRELRAWVDDDGALRLQGYNAEYDNRPFPVSRTPGQQSQEAASIWVGQWRTTRGLMDVSADGSNFVGWVTGAGVAGNERRERVAFEGSTSQASGAWDTVFDSRGTPSDHPVQWGDLQLTLSADGNSFTGRYRVAKPVGFQVVQWTGERVTPRRQPPRPASETSTDVTGVMQAAGGWPGDYLSVDGARVRVTRNGDALEAVGADRRAGPAERFTVAPVGRKLEGVFEQGSRRGRLIADPDQPADRIVARVVEGADTNTYVLCRASSADASLVYSSQGLWAGLSQGRINQESDGTSTLFVELRVRDVAHDRVLRPSDFSLRLPEHQNADFRPGYHNGATGADDVPFARLRQCEQTAITFRFPDVDSSIRKVAVRHGAFDTAEFDVSELTAAIASPSETPTGSDSRPSPAEPATPPASPSPPSPAPSAFQPLNRVDVRVDRVIVARGYPTHQVHAFVTVKNTSAVPQYFTSGFVKAVLADADGVSWERSQPYRASGEPAELFGSTPVIQPGGELRVRYVFVPDIDARLTSITLSEGVKQAQFPVSGL